MIPSYFSTFDSDSFVGNRAIDLCPLVFYPAIFREALLSTFSLDPILHIPLTSYKSNRKRRSRMIFWVRYHLLRIFVGVQLLSSPLRNDRHQCEAIASGYPRFTEWRIHTLDVIGGYGTITFNTNFISPLYNVGSVP